MKEASKFRIAIVGSRGFKPLSLIEITVKNLGPCIIVSGGARGVDTAAEKAARELNYPEPEIHIPDWNKHGKPAEMIRNRLIIDSADGVIAFWDGKSRGTKGSIDLARKAGKPLALVLMGAVGRMKIFKQRELHEAYQYAADGGQALHLFKPYDAPNAPGVFKRSSQWGHLLDQDEGRLISTAKRLGVRKIAVGHRETKRQHIDLCGKPLLKAIEECE